MTDQELFSKIVPYLPYKLKGKWGVHTWEIVGASCLKKISIRVSHYNKTAPYGRGVIPILRPLNGILNSDAYNEIKEQAGSEMNKDAWEVLEHQLRTGRNIHRIPYWAGEILYKHHFDWRFDLIPKDLAIDSNTIK